MFFRPKVAITLALLVLGGTQHWFPATVRADVTLSQPLTIRWRYDSPFTLNLTPASDSDRIYLPLASGTIVALRARADSSTGVRRWEANFPLSCRGERAVFVAQNATRYDQAVLGQRRALGTLRALGRDGGVTLDANPGLPYEGSGDQRNGYSPAARMACLRPQH